jgi:hypothetical protein
MRQKFRQEVLNVLLAQLLQERGVIGAPENIIKLDSITGRRMPDVLVNFRGLRTAIEGEIGYRKRANELALKAARQRVDEGISHIGVAVVYPADIRDVEEFANLKRKLAQSQLQIAIVTETGDTGFVAGDTDYLASALSHAFDQLVQEDIVTRAVAKLDAGIERFADAMVTKKGDIGRIAASLGIRELARNKRTEQKD